MNNTFNRNLRVGYGFSILLLLAIGLVGWIALKRLQQSDRSVDHSTLVIQQLEQTLSEMKDAETGQRGYLLTGREQFLEPYRGAAQHALSLSDSTLALTRDNVIQQNNLKKIQSVIRQRLNILEELIAQRRAARPVTENDLDRGKMAMDELRTQVRKAEGEEQRLLLARSEQVDRYNRQAPLFIGISILLALTLGISSYLKVVAGGFL